MENKKKIYVLLADGFEEIEGLTVIDILRRAAADVTSVSVSAGKYVTGSHGIEVAADRLFDETDIEDGDMLVLPGGMPGTRHLANHEGVKRSLLSYSAKGKYIAAICAAPSVLGKYGLLKGKTATSYPGFEDELDCARYVTDEVAVDGRIITSRGMGTAIPFALRLVSVLFGQEKAEEIRGSIIFRA